MLNPRVVWISAALLVTAGLGAQPPLRPVDPTRAYQAYGYSIAPPSGEGWLVDSDMEGHQTAFARQIDARDVREEHTLAASVLSYWITDCTDGDTCLAKEVEDWSKAQAGHQVAAVPPGFGHTPALAESCTRVQGRQATHGQELFTDGMICSHPDAPQLIVYPSFSERLRAGDDRFPLAADAVEKFLQGFEFLPLNGPIVDSVRSFEPGLGPIASDGSDLWLLHAQRVTPFDSSGISTERSFGVRSGGRVLYAENSLWVAGSDGVLARYDPRTGMLLASVDLPGGPVAIAYGNGAIWSTHERGDVARVDTGTNRFTERIRVGKATTGVVAAFGSIWVSDRQENRVYRIDPVDNSITARLDVCDVPSDLASFGESIWVACWTGAITRIDATSNRVMATTRVGGSPRLIEALDGALWIANWRHGTVSRFDIDANRVTAIIPIGPAELGFIRAAGGSVWVAGARNVIRILDRPRTAAVD